MIEIEKGIDIPSRRTHISKYPFSMMEIGDSFACDDERVRSAATVWGKNNNKAFSVRRMPDGKFRVWRVE